MRSKILPAAAAFAATAILVVVAYRFLFFSLHLATTTLDFAAKKSPLDDLVDADHSEWPNSRFDLTGKITSIEDLSISDGRLDGMVLVEFENSGLCEVYLNRSKIIRRGAPIVVGQKITIWETGLIVDTCPGRMSPRFVLFGPSPHEKRNDLP